MYEALKRKYEMGYITKDTLKGWVKIEKKLAGGELQRNSTKKSQKKSTPSKGRRTEAEDGGRYHKLCIL